MTRHDIPKKVLEALIELEAQSLAEKLGRPFDDVHAAVQELWDEGELEVRSVGGGDLILCGRDGKPTWLQSVK